MENPGGHVEQILQLSGGHNSETTLQSACVHVMLFLVLWSVLASYSVLLFRTSKGKAVPLQAWTGPEGSRKLRFPDFMTTAQDGGRLSALCTGSLYSQKMFLVLISVRG